MAAEATDRAWGVWFMGSEERAGQSARSPGWCSFNEGKPVTYQEALQEKKIRERMYPNASFEVREVSPFEKEFNASGPVPAVPAVPAPSPAPPKKPYLPPRLQERPLPFLIGGELLTNQEELARLLFRTEPSILDAVSRVVDFASPDSLSFEAALEKAWELGKAASMEPATQELPLPPLALERSRYLFAVERAAAIFALLKK